MIVIETERLALHEFTDDDAAFVLRLVNEPSFLRYIGDRGVRTLDDARRYIADGPVAGYARYGYGLLRVARKSDGTTVGMCGVLNRDTLPDPDIGFSLLPEFWSQGYALEVGGGRDDACARDRCGSGASSPSRRWTTSRRCACSASSDSTSNA